MRAAITAPAVVTATDIMPGDVSGGPSTSQTIMVPSLQRLLSLVPSGAPAAAYRSAVMAENVLAKRTAGGREWAFRQLRRFYALDPGSLLFRAMRDLWGYGPDQTLLAMLCALARDPVLRASASVILTAKPGQLVGPQDFELAIEAAFPSAYKDSTRQATAQKVASSWTQSRHLCAEKPTRKVRALVDAGPAALSYALLLGHLEGARGAGLFETLWALVLDQTKSHLSELASTASQQGMLEFRNAGGVVDVSFRHLLRPFDDQVTIL